MNLKKIQLREAMRGLDRAIHSLEHSQEVVVEALGAPDVDIRSALGNARQALAVVSDEIMMADLYRCKVCGDQWTRDLVREVKEPHDEITLYCPCGGDLE